MVFIIAQVEDNGMVILEFDVALFIMNARVGTPVYNFSYVINDNFIVVIFVATAQTTTYLPLIIIIWINFFIIIFN